MPGMRGTSLIRRSGDAGKGAWMRLWTELRGTGRPPSRWGWRCVVTLLLELPWFLLCQGRSC